MFKIVKQLQIAVYVKLYIIITNSLFLIVSIAQSEFDITWNYNILLLNKGNYVTKYY